jgi:pilus assembly protein Flp/PilA
MKWILGKCWELVWKEEGATATEYAVMIALVIIVLIVSIAFIGKRVDNSFQGMAGKIPEH